MLNEFGFSSDSIVSYVAVIPIVYYRFNGGDFHGNSKKELKKYIVIAQVKQIFGAASNSALANIREALRLNQKKSFRMDYLNNVNFTGDRTLRYTDSEIDSLFENYEKNAYTFMILTLLYPNLKYSQKNFHQDHMHPFASFEQKKIKNLIMPDGKKIDTETIEE